MERDMRAGKHGAESTEPGGRGGISYVRFRRLLL